MDKNHITGFEFLMGLTLLSLFACKPGAKQEENKEFASRKIISGPTVIKAGDPVVHFLSDYPAPKRIDISTKQAPVVRPADFFVPMKNFNTEQGLAMSSIICGFRDHAGNLWFGTSGNGVSKYDGKSFTNFNSSNGLIHNLINCITEDSHGNIWFGTYGGISVYDGRSFNNYTTDQGLSDNDISKILEDKEGNIWICSTKGVSRIKQGKDVTGEISFINYGPDEGLDCVSVDDVIQDSQGILWFATDNGVYKYIPVEESKNGIAFKNYSKSCGLEGIFVKCIAEDQDGVLWFGTSKGVSSYDPSKEAIGEIAQTHFTATNGLVSNNLRCITVDIYGNIWIGTAGGVSEYNKKEDTFLNITTKQGLTNNIVCSITADDAGSLWFGTLGGGLCRYDGKSIISFTAKQGLPGTVVYAVTEDHHGNLWFGTNDAGITKYNRDKQGIAGKSFTNYATAQGLSDDYIISLMVDRKDNLWMGSPSGLLKYDGKSFTKYTAKQGLVDDNVVNVKADRHGNLWIGTYEGGISKFDGKSFSNFTTAQGLVHNTVWDIMEDKLGNIWFATRGGLSIYNGDTFKNFTTNQGLPDNKLSSVIEDQNGNVLIGTWGGGVSVIRKKIVEKILKKDTAQYGEAIFENYSTNEGLSNNVVYNILEDSTGNIFIGTNEGITVLRGGLDPTGRNFAKAGLENYNQKAGYPIKDVSNNCSMFIDSRGIIWAGTGDKLVRFDYGSIHRSEAAPRVFIQDVRINNENISWYSLLKGKYDEDHPGSKINYVAPYKNNEQDVFGKILSNSGRDTLIRKFSAIRFDSISPFNPVPENLVLPYAFNSISFDFVGVETRRPFLVRYQYMLKGYNDNWSPADTKSTASFGNLPFGRYTFLIKAQSPDGIWSQPVAYDFEILPPWYRTWPAYLFYALMLGGLVYLVDKFQRKRLISIERQRTMKRELEQAKEIEKSYFELQVAQAQLIQSEKMATLGELAAGIAHEIQNPLNFVNNFSEVSAELAKEMNEEIEKGNTEEVKEITADLIQNLEIISQHGKRASSIVKGMLEHSRTSKGEKRLTDINALADEFLRLSYHGLRVKDKSFNANFRMEADENLSKVNVVPQDIGRVLLNLINNAFYAVAERIKQNTDGYKPEVIVSTKKLADKIEIRVKDNGNGIPDSLKDRIFQPFFTTKPSGQGTGLGLSLSFDIIKAHGGELKVESTSGLGTEFIIELPINGS